MEDQDSNDEVKEYASFETKTSNAFIKNKSISNKEEDQRDDNLTERTSNIERFDGVLHSKNNLSSKFAKNERY